MTTILVRPPELRQSAEQLRSSARKIDRSLLTIDAELNSLKGQSFLGNRADALQSHYTAKRDALLRAKELVMEFSVNLSATAELFEKADRASSATQEPPLPASPYVASVPPRTYALLSSLAYSNVPETPEELVKQGWEVLSTSEELNTSQEGYFGVAFINPKTGDVVIAHRGTDQWNLNPFNGKSSDVDDDISLRLGAIPDQYWISRKFVDQIKDQLEDDARFSDYTIVHTGHSLGAVLADLNALTDGSKGIAFDNPGTLQIISRHQDVFQADNRSHLISYQSNPNLVHLGGENAGYVVQIIPEEGGAVHPIMHIDPALHTYVEIKQTVIHHDIDNIVKSFSEETGFPIGYFPPGTGEGNRGYHNLNEFHAGRVDGTANACYPPPPLPKL